MVLQFKKPEVPRDQNGFCYVRDTRDGTVMRLVVPPFLGANSPFELLSMEEVEARQRKADQTAKPVRKKRATRKRAALSTDVNSDLTEGVEGGENA